MDKSINAPEISVVIPVYKAELCIDELIRRLRVSLSKIDENYEIVLVEDCGGDSSWEIIQRYALSDPRIKGIKFSRNFGQHYGISAGLDKSSGNYVVVMDCDLQDRPEDMYGLYETIKNGHDIVLARRGKRSHSLIKVITSRAFYSVFQWLSGMKYDPEVGNFRIMSRAAVNNFCLMRENLRFFGALVEWMGYKAEYVDVVHEERFAGNSTYSFSKLFNLAVATIIAYSDKPLKVAVAIGFLLSSASFVAGLIVMYRSVIHQIAVPGWASIVISIYFVGGITMSILGVIGVYIGKIFDEVKGRPLYIVQDEIGFLE